MLVKPNHLQQLDWRVGCAFNLIVPTWIGWLRARFFLSLVGLWDSHLLLRRANLPWLATRRFPLGPIGRWNPRLAQHIMAGLNHFQQSRWHEGLTFYFVVPTWRGWYAPPPSGASLACGMPT